MNKRFKRSVSAGKGLDRRRFLQSAAAAFATPPILAAGSGAQAHAEPEPVKPQRNPNDTYANQAKGVRIVPGQWRPHYPWEHIAWVSPPWPCQDYLWLDFPEAIFTDRGLIYLSHINPAAPAVYESWPQVSWEAVPDGIGYERRLPEGVVFGGQVTKGDGPMVELILYIRNESDTALRDIKLQTCTFLRAAKEFADYTADNKFVHVPERGWVPYSESKALPDGVGHFGLGWRSSNKKADLPVMATKSNQAERFVAMTWLDDTLSMVCNPGHPCMHADPHFPDLEPGKAKTVAGRLQFFEGDLEDFKLAAIKRY